MRLDKFLSNAGFGSRSDVKKIIKSKRISVNDIIQINVGMTIDPNRDTVRLDSVPIDYEEFHYFLLNKPSGFLSATSDKSENTVLDLFESERLKDLFPVGRLDKDTVGLLLVTDNGPLAHALLSPKRHVEKEYYAHIEGIVTKETIQKFQEGIELSIEFTALPAKLEIEEVNPETNTSKVYITIQEGKFHQIKRMFERVNMKVTFLERIRMKNLRLDPLLNRGEYRKLTADEINDLTRK
ncbi:MAG: rRNA pseudouridine synthase [Streptococcaceae bacterium]|jgi:16S rRNA pseudouridine516 synthase|nr:rRNA pseudouridine synthase [Streptococcaceae bacterium]